MHILFTAVHLLNRSQKIWSIFRLKWTDVFPFRTITQRFPPLFHTCHGFKSIWNILSHHSVFSAFECGLGGLWAVTAFVPVSLVVHRHNVHGYVILLVRVQTGDLHSHGRKHPPKWTKRALCESLIKYTKQPRWRASSIYSLIRNL